MGIFMNLIFVFFLVFINGFFVAAEFSVVKVRKSRIETLYLEGNTNAKYALKIVNDLNAYLSACQLGITLASLGLGWVGEPAVSRMIMPIINLFNLSDKTAHSISFVIAFSVITAFHIVLGELAPKSLAIISAEKVALFIAAPLILFYNMTFPIMIAFNHSTNFILKIFGKSQADEHGEAHTDEELKLLVEESYKYGLIDKTELTFVDNIFDFTDKTLKDIMIPRTDMICVFKEDPYDEMLKTIMEEKLTRYPVCVDSKDNVIGFVHIKDLYIQAISDEGKSIDGIVRDVLSVPESMSINALFKIFQKEKEQVAIVIDEYGGTAGIVTIEDILEEIVGEIQDEFDEESERIQKIDENSYLVDGGVPIKDINEALGINIDVEDIDTIGGWLYCKIGVSPQVNARVTYEEHDFIVNKCDKKRIFNVLIKKKH